jgi:hypothetical protein
MINNETSLAQIKDTSGTGPINKQRRLFIGGALTALLASSSRRAMADDESTPNDPSILLLHGIYQPVPLGK